MIYDTKKIQQEAKKDFFKTWEKTKLQLPKDVPGFKEKLLKPSIPEPHPLQNTIQKIRSTFLSLGFKEVENPLFVEEQDVYKQYGPEAPAILDRCYYLAGLPRPDIGLSDSKIAAIKKVVPGFGKNQVGTMKDILRDYKLGRIEGDDFVETIEQGLGITTEQSTQILSLFDELKKLKADPTTTTLRSHMTAAWFSTVAALQDKMERPIKLFSMGLRFRREQKVDASHLRAHYGASCVVIDEDMNLEAGKALATAILKPLGFKELEFKQKEATSTYYANESEYEVYGKHGAELLEIADIGMYSPIALANYDIKYPTFNAGFGIERILMVKEGFTDVRGVMFPQFYTTTELSDEEIARSIEIDLKPKTEDGKKLSARIEEVAAKHANEPSPCSFEAYKGTFLGKKIVVSVLEKESNTKLLGPATLNEIYVHNGGIYGLPKEGFKDKAKGIQEKGINTKITYLRAISDYFAARIEEAIKAGEPYSGQIKMAKTAPDVNIKIGEHAARFLQSKRKEIMLKGPIFTAVEAKLV
ncbi:MAG: O-phosphoserine--tRNA ligase [Candidatus Altiarchaeota archaeon]|nr:O-phosphoserine--tRNA ligase [Candidatus Altiarchaeota archaeon]